MPYDVIAVGSGHNGLVAAAYLAIAGKKVLVVERNAWHGGGVVTREVTLPGFKHDTHSTLHIFIRANPLMQNDELGLQRHFGLKYIDPDICFSTLFEDGTSLVTYRDVERTCEQIAQFSAKDAESYRRFAAHSAALLPAMTHGMFIPPAPTGAFVAMLDQSEEGRDILMAMQKSCYDIVTEWFENERVRLHLLKFATQSTASPEEKGTGIVLYILPGFVHTYPSGLPEGGSGELTNALIRCIEHHGGEVRANAPVKRVLVSGGRCTGVLMERGETIVANDLVIGAIHPHLLGDLVEGVPPELAERARKVQPSAFGAINTHYALGEAPRMKATNLDAAKGVAMEFVPNSLDELRLTYDSFRYGKMQLGGTRTIGTLTANVHTNHDPTRAPAEGGATLYLYTFAPYDLAEGGAAKWDDVKEQVADAMLDEFRKYTTNMGPENILARHVESPLDMERSSASFQLGDIHGVGPYFYQFGGYRPLPELAQYTVPGIERFYLVGPFMHPGGGVFGGGRATAIRICDDLGIDFDAICETYSTANAV